MTNAFISYKREDEVRVGRIARALEAEGVPLWWDRSLVPADSWHETVARELEAAGCVVVMWSPGSVGPEGGYVRDEARSGMARHILVPVILERVRSIPLGFGEVQAIDLSHWRGNPRDPFFQDLVAAVEAKLERAPLPPGRGPKARLARRLAYGGAGSAALVAAVVALVFNALGLPAAVCTIPGPQPELADTCGALLIGDQPRRAERLAWEALPPGDCEALKGFIKAHPDGPYAARASRLLDAGERGGAWAAATRQVPIYVEASDGTPKATEALAETDALDRAKADADQACRPLGAGTVFRYVSVTARAVKWSCDRTGRGVVCGFTGAATCNLQAQIERCG